MIKKIIVTLLVTLLFAQLAKTQNSPAALQQVMPPSPNASAFQKFGDWPVGHVTGIPNINIPLFELQSGKLKLPVSLAYHASGVRINDVGSSTGMGWSVIAGGTVTRAMMGGQPDERLTYGYWDAYPVEPNLGPDAFSNYYTTKEYAAGKWDAQPDVFSYNFGSYSGKFVFDHNKNISLIPYSNLRITESLYPAGSTNPYSFQPLGNSLSGFTIKAPDGSTWLFFEPQYTKNEVVTYDKFSGLCCGADPSQALINEYIESYVRTWNLSMIISADKKDTIRFEYDWYEVTYNTPGATKITMGAQFEGNIQQQLNFSSSTRSVIKNKIQEKWLKKIIFKNGYLEFYQNSLRKDLNGGKKIDSAVLYSSSSGRVKAFVFGYKYLRGTDLLAENQLTASDSAHKVRLFLTSLQESGRGFVLQQPYGFEYERSLPLPAKDKAGGDFWGMANGRTWNFLDDSLILPPSGPWIQRYNDFNQELMMFLKHPNHNWGKQGILTRIQYPAGGHTRFDYEASTASNGSSGGFGSIPIVVCDGGGATITNEDFINNAVVGKIRISPPGPMYYGQLIFSMLANYDSFPPHYVVEIRDSATNSLAHTFSHNPMNPIYSCSDYIANPIPVCKKNIGLPPGTYLIKARNTGQPYQSMFPPDELVFCYISTANFPCRIEYISTGDTAVLIAGGLRIKQITDVDPIANKRVIKKYEYAEPFRPEPLGQYLTETIHDFCGRQQNATVIAQLYSHEGEKVLSSASAYSLVDLNGSHVKYGIVKETVWDSVSQKPNGFTVYKFNVFFHDFPEFTNYKFLPYPPFTGDSWMVGQAEGKYEWKTVNDTTNILVRSEEYRYRPVTLKKKIFGEAFFHQNVEHSNQPLPNPPASPDVYACPPLQFLPTYSEFLVQSFVKHSKFNYSSNYNTPDSTITKVYDDAGNVLVTSQAFEYDTTTLLPKKITAINSKADKTVQLIKYPSDFTNITGSDPLSQGIKRLQNEYIINAEIEKSTYRSNVDGSSNRLISSVFTSFQPTISLPAEIKVAEFATPVTNFTAASVQGGSVVNDSRYKSRVLFTRYDSTGNLLEQEKSRDVKNTYIWDYNQTLPVAQVTNATVDQVAYASFESFGKGNWTYSGPIVTDDSAPTGKKAYNMGAGTPITKTGLTTGTTYIVSYWTKNNSAFTVSGTQAGYPINGYTINGWKHYEHKITGQSTVVIAGIGLLDEVRLYPANAQMISFTYDPLIGMTSQCDVNNRIQYFYYDEFNRLFLVLDQDRKVVKKMCYNYSGQADNCTIYYNSSISQGFTRNNCSVGSSGSLVTYTVPANRYIGTSPASVAAQAYADINLNGQAYANENGTCSTPSYSFIACCGWGTPFSNFGLTGTGSVNFSFVVYSTGSTPIWTNQNQVANLSGAAYLPSGFRTVNYTASGRTWQIFIAPFGPIGIQLISGTPPSPGSAINFSGTYNL